MAEDAVALSIPVRQKVRVALRRPGNWLQLARFAAVGASGYAVNIAVFALFNQGLGVPYAASAVVAFLVAVTNNYLWNRGWTFKAARGRIRVQAPRFLVVSVATFGVTLVLLTFLVEVVGLPDVAAQALSVALGLPLNFLGQKLWSFRP